MKIKVVGLLVLDDNVPLDLACEVIESIQVCGIIQARDELKNALASRMK